MSLALHPMDHLAPVGLDELNGTAALQTRVDRKYLVTPDQLTVVLERVGPGARVLEIDGRRRFGYESIYFDTPGFDAYRGAAHRRPGRFKVRTRRYLDSDGCWVEVKLRDRRGHTIKHRRAHDAARFDQLTPESLAFVASFTPVRDRAHQLEPTVTTRYHRSTLLVGATRTTIDVGVTCAAGDRRVGLGPLVVVETKSPGGPGVVDRVLWDLHLRPEPVSKFGLGTAALFPFLPANKWHRLLARAVHPCTP